jgi:hypothetical protein
MRKLMVIMAVVLLALMAFTANSLAAPQDFVLENQTSFTIQAVHVSPDYTNSWEEDVLGSRTLPSGARIRIRFPHSGGHCMWDLMVKDGAGNRFSWRGLNLCNTNTITVFQRGDGTVAMNAR